MSTGKQSKTKINYDGEAIITPKQSSDRVFRKNLLEDARQLQF
jgi:hypothetical protein